MTGMSVEEVKRNLEKEWMTTAVICPSMIITPSIPNAAEKKAGKRIAIWKKRKAKFSVRTFINSVKDLDSVTKFKRST
jgi:hypothetical protein